LFRPRRRRAVNVAVVSDKVEALDVGIGRISAVHRLTSITDDYVFHQAPNNVIKNRDAQKRQAVSPRNEDRSEDHQRDAGLAVEIFLKVELIVTAGSAAFDDRLRRRRDNGIRSAASLARSRRLARFTRQSRVTCRAEKVDGSQSTRALDVAVVGRVDDDL